MSLEFTPPPAVEVRLQHLSPQHPFIALGLPEEPRLEDANLPGCSGQAKATAASEGAR